MLEMTGLLESAQFFSYLMLSFAFFVGILLMVSQEAFYYFNKALQKELGLKKKVLPRVEGKQIHFVDWLVLKYRFVSGLLISIAAFVLLLVNK